MSDRGVKTIKIRFHVSIQLPNAIKRLIEECYRVKATTTAIA